VVHTPSQQRGLKLLSDEIGRRTRENFCSAKQAFVDMAGPGEFQRLAGEKCANGPPQTSGLGGTQMKLSTECRTVTSAACASDARPNTPFAQSKRRQAAGADAELRASAAAQTRTAAGPSPCEKKCDERCKDSPPEVHGRCFGQCVALEQCK
jgi:hypothetical protein